MSLEQAKNLARELGLDEPSRVDPMEAAYKMTDSYYREQMEARAAEAPPDDDGEGAILARDFGMNGQMPESDKPLELITQEILFYKRQAGGAIIEIGKRLLEAKAQLGHGEWLPWLREKVDISERRAQDFMRIAREYSKSAEIADLGASKALALLALPESERERFAGERHLVDGEEKTVSEMTARELKAAIEEREQARREAEERKAEAAAAEASREKMAQDMRQLKELLASARETEQEKSQALEEARRELQALRTRPVEVAVETHDAAPEQLAAARADGAREAREEAEARQKQALQAAKQQAGERVRTLQEELKKARAEVQSANAQLRQARQDAREAQQRAERSGKQAAVASSERMMKFGVLFQSTQDLVNRLADAVSQESADNQKKMRAALRALADAIIQAAQEPETGAEA